MSNRLITDLGANIQNLIGYVDEMDDIGTRWTKRGTCTATATTQDGYACFLIEGLTTSGNDDLYYTGYSSMGLVTNMNLSTGFWLKRSSTTGTVTFGSPSNPAVYGRYEVNLANLPDEWVYIDASSPYISNYVAWNTTGITAAGLMLFADGGAPRDIYLREPQQNYGTVLLDFYDTGSGAAYSATTKIIDAVVTGKTCRVEWIHIVMDTATTAGNRRLQVDVKDESGNLILRTAAGAVQAASLSRHYSLKQGTYREAAFVDGSIQLAIPKNFILMPSWTIVLSDSGNISPTADIYNVRALLTEHAY